MLFTLTVLLAAAVLLVPLSRRLGLGSVLGYLVGGALIGPSGLRLVTDVHAIADVSELGVVMLLFLIGLEVRPQRLWLMRRAVFGLGTAQVVVTAAVLAACSSRPVSPAAAAIVLGAGLALSSTAIVLPMLGERDLLGTPAGRSTFRGAAVPGSRLRAARRGRAAAGRQRAAAGRALDRRSLKAGGGDRGHPDRRPLPGSAGVPRHRRHADARRSSPRSPCSSWSGRRPWPARRGCRPRSAPSWPACCSPIPNTGTR